ncbi:MAG TPA: hypothetical protein ENK55_01505 [Actinobacteria bacterium]|nr:hypothetical protein [Actinomycetota bacterium]
MLTATARVTVWRTLFEELGIPSDGTVLLVGPPEESFAEMPAIPVLPGGHGMAVLGPPLDRRIPDDATAVATGLDDDAVDAVFMLSAWGDPALMGQVAREAVRITRPGGTVVLGDVDAAVLTESSPAAYRAALLYETYPWVGDRIRDAHAHEAMLGIELLRAGIHPVQADQRDLPMGYFDDADAYEAAVARGLWPGVLLLDEADRGRLLAELRRSLVDARFPVADVQPWMLAHGRK